MKTVLYFTLMAWILMLYSCTKTDQKKCTVKDASGQALYEVTGQQNCQDQIDTSVGEYCDCDTQN